MITVTPLSALRDNYIWCIHNKNYCVIVDPGESEPVIRWLQEKNLILCAILITHHHYDHTGGIAGLLSYKKVPVIGSTSIHQVTMSTENNPQITLNEIDRVFSVLAVPGHTLEHVAYYSSPFLFTGDTLFTGGCGKIFEGTTEQMYQSLRQFKLLPLDTLIFCGHEYTEKNLNFALRVEPHNQDIQERLQITQNLRQQSLPTVPATLALEMKTNPFLRCEEIKVIEAVSNYMGSSLKNPIEVLAALRQWKNVVS